MRKDTTDANTEGFSAGTVSFDGPTSFGQEQTGNPFSQGTSPGAIRGGELFTGIGADTGSDDAGDSGAAPRKRGRPKGSTNAPKSNAPKLSAERLASARGKLRDTLAGVVGFGVSYYGTVRANKYKKVSPFLARKVYDCYQIPKEAAVSVGEPLADTFITWFPEYVETTTKAIDPGLAVARLFIILQQTNENEKLTVQRFYQQYTQPQTATQNGTGQHPNGGATYGVGEPDTQHVEEMMNQWSQGAPTPDEIHPQGPIPEQQESSSVESSVL
jgi:hypothetical protein